LIRDSEAGNIKKQFWLRIPKGITENYAWKRDTFVMTDAADDSQLPLSISHDYSVRREY
jgi:hypothetical protein